MREEQRGRDKHQRRKEEAKDEKILSLIDNSRRRRSPSPPLGSSIYAAFPTCISFPEATPKFSSLLVRNKTSMFS